MDRSGCTFERVGDVRYAKKPAVNGKEHESMTFAGQIEDWLGTVCREEPIPALALIAGPAFLGMLRDKLVSHARPFVRWELDKNITKLDPWKMRTFLPVRLSLLS